MKIGVFLLSDSLYDTFAFVGLQSEDLLRHGIFGN